MRIGILSKVTSKSGDELVGLVHRVVVRLEAELLDCPALLHVLGAAHEPIPRFSKPWILCSAS